jgi:glycosyltransferase involved in cell wall biosynthesis
MTPTFSFIVPTLGRPSLARALQSLDTQPLEPGDEILVVGAYDAAPVALAHGARFLPHLAAGDDGYTERAYGMAHAVDTHLAFLDDDDEYLPGAVAAMRAQIAAAPDRPHLFRMIAPWGETLWRRLGVYRRGDFGGAQFVTPNDPARLGTYSQAYEADYDFIMSTLELYPPGALVWSDTVTYRCAPGVGRDVLLREARG